MVKLVPYGGNRDVEEGTNPKEMVIHSLTNKYVVSAHYVLGAAGLSVNTAGRGPDLV